MKKIYLTIFLTFSVMAYGSFWPVNKNESDSVNIGLFNDTKNSIFDLGFVNFGEENHTQISFFNSSKIGSSNQIGLVNISGNHQVVEYKLFEVPVEEPIKKRNDFQFGLLNSVRGETHTQIGVMNVSESAVLQLGLFNTTWSDVSFQAGLGNLATDAGTQIGAFNYADAAGLQVGFINSSEAAKGQLGIWNYSAAANLQLGALNTTRSLDGLQVGLINVDTSADFPVLPFINFRKPL